MDAPPELVNLAKSIALTFNLDPALVAAVCEQESSWDTHATRYEPAFFTRYIQPMLEAGAVKDLNEAQERSTSWGLMQIMGQTAREFGYTGDIHGLLDPATGIKWGCTKLARCVEKSKQISPVPDIETALLRFNGGNNTQYPKEVMFRIARYR